MKKFVIITAGIMVITGIIGCIILGRTGAVTHLGGGGPLQLKETKTSAISGFEKIEIETVSEKINIVQIPNTELKADLKLDDPDDDVKLVMTPDASGKVLTIKLDRKKQVAFLAHYTGGELDIYLPQSFTGDLSAHSVSGSVEDSDISNLKNVKIETTSGKIVLDDRAGVQGTIDLKSVSGRIEAKNLAAFKEVNASSTSGRIELSNLSGKVDAHSVSGRIELAFDNLSDNIKARTTSGRVLIDLPDNANATYSFSTTSGGLSNKESLNLTRETRSYYEGKVGNGDKKVEVETVSGGLSIE